MPVLSFIPKSLGGEEVWSKVGSLRSFLTDLAIFTPLSSDAVECVHGLYQAKLHRFRGRKPSDSKAPRVGALGSNHWFLRKVSKPCVG